MEEIVNLFFQMWVEFWNTSTGADKLISMMNLLGATYTFIVGLALSSRIMLYSNKTPHLTYILAKVSIYLIVLGSFLSMVVVRVPGFIEVILSAGLTSAMTFTLILTDTKSGKFFKRIKK